LGNSSVCGLLADGSIECFDYDSLGRLPPPVGPWVEITGHRRFACARAADGRAECWGPGFGDGAADLQCDYNFSVLIGSLDSAPFDGVTDTGTQSSSGDIAGYRFAYRVYSDDTRGSGLMVFDGTTDLGESSVAERALLDRGEVSLDSSVLQISGTETDPGPIYCTGSGSGSTISLNVDEVSLKLENVHRMGTCPGAPVSGEITVCPEGSCGRYTGTLEAWITTLSRLHTKSERARAAGPACSTVRDAS
jgi:hypothetical protein